ncbi:Hint domain-containing protein [Octadecabacter sp. G9-8]|uniref:Hint domain-containing protein n=1 Tax=Octadecabacter dasysiphoniae TaxID=2909341 RepID=A0ABS9CYU2_9RHOB|nr:Hint domain-containing protein [Octadecabacter dasysiphoniae]MCF2872442.1 Hint domain-containing protein [Octadecabacter dasysiphoniae]
MAEIDGDNTNNTLTGTNGSDTIKGFDGNDSINGGSGNDTLYGGDGDDSITGGGGDDVIVGGRGNDTMAAGSGSPSDTFVIRDGDGNDTITDFDPNEPDIVDFRMDEMNTYQDVLDRMSPFNGGTLITYDNGSTLFLENVRQGDLSATNFTFGTGPVCLHAGTMIDTPYGAVRIEHLCAGDLVLTADHGPQPVRAIVHQVLHFSTACDDGKPIMIKRGALGQGVPVRATIVSPQHRIVLHDAARGGDVFIAAKRLTSGQGMRQMRGRRRAEYHNLLFARHEVIFANGMAVESLLLSAQVLAAAPKLHDAIPQPRPPMTLARAVVKQDPRSAGRNDHLAANGPPVSEHRMPHLQ